MIYTGCDLQIAVFLLLSLFWTKTRRHHQNATTKTPPHIAINYNHLHHSPLSEHRAVTIYAVRMEERCGSGSNLPPRSPAQNAHSKISRQKNARANLPAEAQSPLHRSEERKGEGWRVVSRLAGARCEAANRGGARSKKGGGSFQKAGVNRGG